MGFLDTLNVSASGMTAERLRMDVIANNLANANTTHTDEGGPYRRKMVIFAPASGGSSFADALAGAQGDSSNTGQGVQVQAIVPDNSPLKRIYEPGHPDADAQGYVSMPNVDTVTEMVDMMSATRAYEADVTAVNAVKAMAQKALEIGKA